MLGERRPYFAASSAERSSYSDQALVDALVARHPAAALTAWRRFLPLVTQILRRRLRSSDITSDVIQDVFECFFGSVHTLRDPRALRAFIVTLADRALTNELRRRQRRARLQSLVERQHLGELGEQADAFSRHAFWRLHRLLERLRERDRRVLLMCSVERRGVEEVATLLGVSVPTVRRRLTRARSRVTSWSETDPFLREFASAALARLRARRLDSLGGESRPV